MIIRLTSDDVKRYNFSPQDEGKWCVRMNGCVMGFADSLEQLQDMMTRHKFHHLSLAKE